MSRIFSFVPYSYVSEMDVLAFKSKVFPEVVL